MDRKGYSSGADTGAQPPSLTTPPSGPPAKRMRGRTQKSRESLPLPLSMSSSQSLADRRHHFCHLIISKRMRKRGREQWQEVDVKEQVWWTAVWYPSILGGQENDAGVRWGWRGGCRRFRTLTYGYTFSRAKPKIFLFYKLLFFSFWNLTLFGEKYKWSPKW